LPEAGEVSLSIFNMSGQVVKKLVAGEMNAGRHSFTWDATNERGERRVSVRHQSRRIYRAAQAGVDEMTRSVKLQLDRHRRRSN
jgi:flagellar hook assembly protein FlgD